ncbi:MAG TPA: hypothetical protein VJM80_06305 [bacterium]|nr:hypothetical protein [bacterium]
MRQSTFGKALLRTIAPSYQGKSGFFVIPAKLVPESSNRGAGIQ